MVELFSRACEVSPTFLKIKKFTKALDAPAIVLEFSVGFIVERVPTFKVTKTLFA